MPKKHRLAGLVADNAYPHVLDSIHTLTIQFPPSITSRISFWSNIEDIRIAGSVEPLGDSKMA
jgi:hypothetical protein